MDERLKWNIQEKLKSGVEAAKSGGDWKSEPFKINGKPAEFTPFDHFASGLHHRRKIANQRAILRRVIREAAT